MVSLFSVPVLDKQQIFNLSGVRYVVNIIRNNMNESLDRMVTISLKNSKRVLEKHVGKFLIKIIEFRIIIVKLIIRLRNTVLLSSDPFPTYKHAVMTVACQLNSLDNIRRSKIPSNSYNPSLIFTEAQLIEAINC